MSVSQSFNGVNLTGDWGLGNGDRQGWGKYPDKEEAPYVYFAPIGVNKNTTLWPSGGYFTGLNPSVDAAWLFPQTWDSTILWSGVASFVFHISGLAKDSAGQTVAGATLKLYRTADDVLVQTTSSRSDGTYSFGTFDTSTQHYVVAYRAAPDIEGTTVNTLTGA